MNYNDRLARFQEKLANAADLAFFPASADLEYLTGVPRDIPNFGMTIHPGGWLEGVWITPKSEPLLTISRMSAELGGMNQLKVQMRVLGEFDDPAALVRDILRGFNLPAKPRVAISDRTTGDTVTALQAILPDATFSSATQILRSLRVIKSEDEIAVMRRAGEITEAAFSDVLKQLKWGMTELEIISEVDYQLRRHGALGPSFTTTLYNAGPDHPLLFGDRLNTWPRVLDKPVSVLFDFGGVYNGYCYDFGRTVAFGEPNAQFLKVYDLVMAAQKAGIATLQAGQKTAAQADAAARQVIVDGGYGEAFRHRLGHSIGLDVHEPPFLTASDQTVLQEGMLFTVEPSITLVHEFSARVEDVVVVRPGGGEPLTKGFQTLHVID
jgi:Xaa-Pro aminopeptidase